MSESVTRIKVTVVVVDDDEIVNRTRNLKKKLSLSINYLADDD